MSNKPKAYIKLKTKPNYHIHITISKQKCLDNRIEYIKENKNRQPETYRNNKYKIHKLRYMWGFKVYMKTNLKCKRR